MYTRIIAVLILSATTANAQFGDILRKMSAVVDEATRDVQVRELAPNLGFELDPKGAGTPEDAAAFLKAQMALWATTTKELGIEPQ